MSDQEELKIQIEELKKEVERLRSGSTDNSVLFHDEVHRRTRNMKLAMDQAARANKTKSAFLERVSYELLTPMNTILGMTNLVLETELSEKQRRYLELVGESADNLLGVVNNILDFSKIELGKLEFETEEFSLRERMEYELYPQTLKAQRKGIEFNCIFDPGVPDLIECDENRLIQVLTNLVDNGIFFTEEGGVLLHVSLRGFTPEGQQLLRFSVTDTGIGIRPVKQQIILESFNQGAIPPSGNSDENLLGLAVSGHLVKLVGGEIGIQSQGEGEGAQVWFTWPVSVVVDSKSSPSAVSDNATYLMPEKSILEGSILVVEDDPASRVLLETFLRRTGATVATAGNGEEGYRYFLDHKPDLIFMDVQMPVMNGLECTEKIRNHEKMYGGHVAIVALTALVMHGDRDRCLKAGMDNYIAKPMNKDQVIDMVRQYLTSTVLLLGEHGPGLVEKFHNAGWNIIQVGLGRMAIYEAGLCLNDLVVVDLSRTTVGYLETVNNIRRLTAISNVVPFFLGIGETKEDELQPDGLDGVLPENFTIDQLIHLMHLHN